MNDMIRSTTLLAAQGGPARHWPLLLPIFLVGTVATAYGLTIAESDRIIFAGMVLTGIAVVSMWLPGKGIRPSTTAVIMMFIIGSACTALSLTVQPTNTLFCAGMMLTGAGTIGMWMVGKTGKLATVTGVTFMSGISAQAFGLTITPSDPFVMLGMILIAGAVFGMWVYSNR
jgi:hypothetical protein